MNKMQFGCTALLAVSIAAACGDDPVRTDSSEEDLLAASSGSRSGGSDRGRDDRSGKAQIAMLDDCDPRDVWPGAGCTLRRGDVSFAEFNDFLDSPHYPTTVVGHPSWTNEPSYLKVEEGRKVRVTNEGGRPHTFTEVAEYGGGRVPNPALNKGLVMAPECALLPGAVDRNEVAPGRSLALRKLEEGNHKYQCCFHPWMRALIKVKPDDHRGH